MSNSLRNSLALWVNDTSTVVGRLHDVATLGFDRLIVCIVKHAPAPTAYAYQPSNLAQILHDAPSVGLSVDAWFYGYPTGIEQQVATIAAILNQYPQIENAIADFEVEWERASGDAGGPADQFFHGLADATARRVALHLSSFDNPDDHPLPYARLLTHCASLMPQAYQVDGTPIPLVMSRTLGQCAPLAHASLGGAMIGTANTPAGLAAIAAAGPSSFEAANVWCWDGDTGANVVDIGIRGREASWADAIRAYRKLFG
jgi:hypothetical protein